MQLTGSLDRGSEETDVQFRGLLRNLDNEVTGLAISCAAQGRRDSPGCHGTQVRREPCVGRTALLFASEDKRTGTCVVLRYFERLPCPMADLCLITCEMHINVDTPEYANEDSTDHAKHI